MAYDLTKLVRVQALQQLAQRIKENYYNKNEIDEKLEEYIKNIYLNDEILDKIDQEISISIRPSETPGALLINNEEVIIPDFIGRQEAINLFETANIKWETFNSTPTN